MDTLRTFASDAEAVRLLTVGVLVALLLASVWLNIYVLNRIRGLDAHQRDVAQRLGHRMDRRDLATVAVAAVVLTKQSQEINHKDIEAQVESLLQHWTRIEEMASEVSQKIEDVVPPGRQG